MNKALSFDAMVELCPRELQTRIEGLKSVLQREDKHPEGNVWKHTKIVAMRVLRCNSRELSWAALFHDIGKDVTTKMGPKGFLQAIGHEEVSAKLVEKHKDFLRDMGANPRKVEEIVANHMRIKLFPEMRFGTQMEMRKLDTFGLLQVFTQFDDMSTLTEQELKMINKD